MATNLYNISVEFQRIKAVIKKAENLIDTILNLLDSVPFIITQTITGDGSSVEFTINNVTYESAVVLIDGTTYEQIYGSIRYSGSDLIVNTGTALSAGQTIKVIIIKKQV